MSKKRKVDSHTSAEKWDELSERLRHGVIVAEDNANSNIEYFIMPSERLLHPTAASEDYNTPVGVAATSGNEPVKKSKETYHLIIQEKKGGGGFGVVYKAGMTTPGGQQSKDICLKQARDQTWDTLIKENDIFSHLSSYPHDNIIKRFFLCQSSLDTFLGLEYFDGRTLSDHIVITKHFRKQRPTYCLGEKHLINILRQQTDAILHLQNYGVFHCDFKPDNILYNEKRLLSKLIDFGMAVFGNRVSESFKSQGGTTEYMAPETLVDSELMIGTDLFGLGAALHHLVTLEIPWHALDNITALKANKLDYNCPNFQKMKAQRRLDIRAMIKEEIVQYRQDLSDDEILDGVDGNDVTQKPMFIQEELMSNEDYSYDFKEIICRMLRHNPRSRPNCEDILKYLNEQVIVGHPPIEPQMSMTSMGSQSSSSSISKATTNGHGLDDPGEGTSAQSNNNVPIFLSDSQLGSSFQDMQIDSSNRASAMAPNLSMFNKNSSHVYQPSDAAMAYPSTEMMSVTQSGMEPAESEYVEEDPTGMSEYMAQHQSSESSAQFSMPHSERYSEHVHSPGTIQHSILDGIPPTDVNTRRMVELDGDHTYQLSPAGTFRSKAPQDEDDDEDDL